MNSANSGARQAFARCADRSPNQHRQRRVVAARWGRAWWWVLVAAGLVGSAAAADRTTLLLPLAERLSGQLPAGAVSADQAFGDSAGAGWRAYTRLWQAHHADPTNADIRRFLGLPLQGTITAKQHRGRSAPRWLAWRRGSYQQIETPHFILYSRADAQTNQLVAQDLEQCYWVWTQMFFPLWNGCRQVTAALAAGDPDQPIADLLARQPARLSVGRRLRVVLFRDASEYEQTLAIPGIERSTGFYSDEKQTTFLYATEHDDSATRRHELVHQLFREASDCGLRGQMPGEESDFWLVEGIAGYFESLHLAGGYATVGGWDSPRLQFARQRFFVHGDRLPLRELRADGRLAAQQRTDLARWYAHAIARTHQLIDGGDAESRRWVYRRLAELYEIAADFAGRQPDDDDSILEFLSIDDAHLAENPADRELTHLCLAGCDVTPRGLNRIQPSRLTQLTLTGNSIDVESVARIIADPTVVQQVSLERTGIDQSIARLLDQATSLRELDLSGTTAGDAVIQAIADAQSLSTLWMTGTRVTDQSIDLIIRLNSLQHVDLQQTGVTEQAIQRLRDARPELNVNPLQLRSENR